MNLILLLLTILAATNLTVFVGRKIHIPSVVSLIVAGIIFGLPVVRESLIGRHESLIFTLGDAGLLALMLLAGLESSWHMLYKERRDATYVALFAALIPLGVGFLVFLLLGYSVKVAFVVGICMSISAEATRAKVLMELKKLKTRVGAALIGAGLIDDTLGLSLFILMTLFVREAGTGEQFLVAASIIIFFAGLVVQRVIGKEHRVMEVLKDGLNWLIVPFFFVSIGIHFRFSSLTVEPLILLLILSIAFAGKFAGAFLARAFLNFSWKQLYLIGWAMNSRGALELAIALIAFRNGIIHNTLYSSLIVMALVTTLLFPFVISRMIRKDEKIMGSREG